MAIKRPDQLSGVSSIGENDILIAEINPDDPLNRKVVKISKSDVDFLFSLEIDLVFPSYQKNFCCYAVVFISDFGDMCSRKSLIHCTRVHPRTSYNNASSV